MAFSGNQEMEINDPSGLVWVNHTGTDAVPDAIYAGRDPSGQALYVARAMLSGYLSVGKFAPGPGGVFLLDNGSPAATFLVLTNPKQVQTKWALAEGPGKFPPTAVLANVNMFSGISGVNPGKYYIGRTKHQGANMAVGFVWSSGLPASSGQPKVAGENRLGYSVQGRVHFTDDFEILLAKAPDGCQCPPIFHLNCSQSCPKKK